MQSKGLMKTLSIFFFFCKDKESFRLSEAHKCVESSVRLCEGPKWTCVRGVGGQTWRVAPLIAAQALGGSITVLINHSETWCFFSLQECK